MIIFLLITLAFCVIYFLLPRKLEWIAFVLLTVGLSVLAYYCVPAASDDLSRYYHIIDQLRTQDFAFLREQIRAGVNDWDALPMAGYYFYFISRLPSNNYLPAITMFVVYGVMYLMLYRCAHFYKVNKFNLFLGAIFILTTYWYYDTCSGIRNGLAFAIVLLGIYLYFVEKKSILFFIFFSVIACLLHTAAILPVVLAVIVIFTGRLDSKYINILVFFGLSVGGALMTYLSNVSDNELIQLIADKTESALDVTVSLQTNYLVNVAVFILSIIIMYYCSYYVRNFDSNNRLFFLVKFASVMLMFMLGSITSSLLFLRFARWLIPPIIGVVLMVGLQLQKGRLEGNLDLSIYSDISKQERLRVNSRFTFLAAICICLVVHYWYDLNGSSLIWLHFE